MPTVQIIIDVSGEAAGSPGVAREFTYSKIDPLAPTVTLSLGDTSGVTSYEWSILRQPIGATSVLSDETDATPTFIPTVGKTGTYLVQCVVNGGEAFGRNGVAFSTRYLALRKPAPGETVQFSVLRGWEVAMAKVIDVVDLGSAGGGARRRKVIDIVDCTAAPPTEVSIDRYILDTTGAVHADWDGAASNDIVEFNGVDWEATVPEEGWNVYVDARNKDYRFVDDGVPVWEEVSVGDITTVWAGNTFDASQTEIFLNGVFGVQYPVSANSSVGFLINVMARDNTNNDTKRWKIEGALHRDGSDNTTLVGGAAVKSVISESAGALTWDLSAEADDVAEALAIKVVGELAKTINWRADGFMTVLT